MSSFTQRQTTPKKGSSYRGSVVRKFESSDDDSSEGSDTDEEQLWKRQKTYTAPHSSLGGLRHSSLDSRKKSMSQLRPRHGGPGMSRAGNTAAGSNRRINNVWGSIVEEQRQEQVEREITSFGVSSVMTRDVESYSYSNNLPLGAVSGILPDGARQHERKLVKGIGAEDDDSWLAKDSPRHSEEEEGGETSDDLRERLKKRGSMVADRFRRANVKTRLGVRAESPEPETPMKSIDIDPNGEVKVVAGQLAYSLHEPKRDLVLRIVKVLGVKKSIEIWKQTEKIEHDGGMMIMNRSRRRSPGGVFIHMMKTDPDVSQEDIKEIFADEKKIFEAERKRRRKHKLTRKLATSSMDTDERNVKEEDDDGKDDDDADEAAEEKILVDKEAEEDMNDAWDMKLDGDISRPDVSNEGAIFKTGENEGKKSDKARGRQLPQSEFTDFREENNSFLFGQHIAEEDIPRRNEDSEPEDGEVIDDGSDDN